MKHIRYLFKGMAVFITIICAAILVVGIAWLIVSNGVMVASVAVMLAVGSYLIGWMMEQ